MGVHTQEHGAGLRRPADDRRVRWQPARGWENPEALGTMRLVRTNLAEFRQDEQLVARFTPAPRHWKTVTCD